MIRLLCATLVVICLGCGFAISLRAQEPGTAGWVPFVAKWVQTSEVEGRYGPTKAKMSGIYVMDKRGSWFKRTDPRSIHSELPVLGVTNSAFICDRANHKLYLVDFTWKTIKPLPVPGGDQPVSTESFDKQHSQDKYLGKKAISGVECVGYAIHHPRRKGKYVSEEWYAPSVNYLTMETKLGERGSQLVITRIEEIHVGIEPDPQYFKLPEGFKLVK